VDGDSVATREIHAHGEACRGFSDAALADRLNPDNALVAYFWDHLIDVYNDVERVSRRVDGERAEKIRLAQILLTYVHAVRMGTPLPAVELVALEEMSNESTIT
jgi:hypothetical protein